MSKKIFIYYIATFLLSLNIFAATLKKINIYSLTREAVPKGLVKAYIPAHEGDIFQLKNLSVILKNKLEKSTLFNDYEFNFVPLGNDQYELNIKVALKPKVASIIFSGNEIINDERLEDLLINKVDEPFDEKALSEGKMKIVNLYISKGFNGIKVTEKVIKSKVKNEVNLKFEIVESERFKIRGLKFSGNKAFSDSKLDKIMRTDVSLFGYIFPMGFLDETTLKYDIKNIQREYRNNGFLDAEVENVERTYNDKHNKIYLTVNISEGKSYKVSKVSISGNKLFTDEILFEKIKLKQADVYNKKYENSAVDFIKNKYYSKGYVDVSCYTNYKVNPVKLTIAVEFRINEGVASTIRDIIITGNRVTKDYVVRRELAMLPGDICNMTKINATKSRLKNMNYFETVEAYPVSTESPTEKDIRIDLKDKRTGQLSLGAGFSSVDSLLASFTLAQSNFDINNWPSFRGGGQRMKLSLETGTYSDNYGISFSEPWLMNKPLRLDLNFYKTSRDYIYYTYDTFGGSVALTKRLKKLWRGSIKYTIEDITLKNFDNTLSQELHNEEGSYIVSKFNLILSKDTRNNYIYPTKGYKTSISTGITSEFIGGYTNLLSLDVNYSEYHNVYGDIVLKLAAVIGMKEKLSGDNIALFDRYFAGGLGSIRGFAYRDVGPIDTSEEPIGGLSSLTSTAELLIPLVDKFKGVVFSDFGNVWRNSLNYDIFKMNGSVGIGLRIELPIGPIAIDYAYPIVIQQDNLNRTPRFHFNMGYAF